MAECEVRLMRPGGGQRLKAFVVLEGLGNETREANGDVRQERQGLERWLRQRLSAPERPASLAFGESVPRDAQGKVADWP